MLCSFNVIRIPFSKLQKCFLLFSFVVNVEIIVPLLANTIQFSSSVPERCFIFLMKKYISYEVGQGNIQLLMLTVY